MRKGFLIFFLMLCIGACKKKDKVPAHILPVPKMQALLWDIMRADKFVVDFLLVSDSSLNRNEESIKIYQQVLEVHSVSKDEFSKSFSWYKEHPAVLQVIMDSLNNRRGEAPTQLVKPADSANQSLKDPVARDSATIKKRRNLLKPD
ncbi:MAG: DUF4296 domain-containing protein [Chitinophagaceae bacterium]